MWSSDIDKGNLDKAIVDFGKAIEIDPSNARPYNNRGFCYFLKKDYDKAWDDVDKVEELGYKVHEVFLADLKKASGKDN
jgi:tetratricopeptide (TPR) repeat protein